MFSAKDNDDSFVRKHTHHATGWGQGVKDLNYLTLMEESKTHQTTGEEEDLPDLLNMQVLLPQSDSHLPECWQLWDIITTSYHWVGGRGAGWPALHPLSLTFPPLKVPLRMETSHFPAFAGPASGEWRYHGGLVHLQERTLKLGLGFRGLGFRGLGFGV